MKVLCRFAILLLAMSPGGALAQAWPSKPVRVSVSTGPGLATNQFLFKSVPYDAVRDFTPVAMVSDTGPFVITVQPELPVKTLPDVIAYAKANPGKLSYAFDVSSGYAALIGQLIDGLVGAKKRIGMAQKVLPDFGIGFFCGLGVAVPGAPPLTERLRKATPETIGAVLDLHREAASL